MSSFIRKKHQGINTPIVLLGKLLSLDYAVSSISANDSRSGAEHWDCKDLGKAPVHRSRWELWLTREQNPQVRVINRDLPWKSKQWWRKGGWRFVCDMDLVGTSSTEWRCFQNGWKTYLLLFIALFFVVYCLPFSFFLVQTKAIQDKISNVNKIFNVNKRFNVPLLHI